MLQTAKVIMTATLKASDKGLELIDKARCKKGWNKTEQAWADIAWTSPGTLRRFWKGIAIQSDTFKAICKAVDEDWGKVYDEGLPSNDDVPRTVPITSKRLAFAIAGSIDEVDKSKLDAITALLRKLGGDASIEILNIEEGSIKLTLSGSLESLERIESLFMSGELAEILGNSVQDVHFIDADELSKSIRENGGNSLNLHKADLRRADLRGADLHRADLREADLREADLREADLREADLRGANLRGADLRGANLREANLSRSQPARSQPARSQPARSQPDRSRPARSQPARSQPDRSLPDQSQPERSQPDQSRPARSQPDQSQPDQSRPDQSQPERSRPARSLSERSRPERSHCYRCCVY